MKECVVSWLLNTLYGWQIVTINLRNKESNLARNVNGNYTPLICKFFFPGCLLNTFVEELIIRVTTVEDIPDATAAHLVTVFGIVIDRAPQVFQVSFKLFFNFLPFNSHVLGDKR